MAPPLGHLGAQTGRRGLVGLGSLLRGAEEPRTGKRLSWDATRAGPGRWLPSLRGAAARWCEAPIILEGREGSEVRPEVAQRERLVAQDLWCLCSEGGEAALKNVWAHVLPPA